MSSIAAISQHQIRIEDLSFALQSLKRRLQTTNVLCERAMCGEADHTACIELVHVILGDLSLNLDQTISAYCTD